MLDSWSNFWVSAHKVDFLLSPWLSSQNFHKKISTQLLTLLIIRAIVQLEQKRGVQREQKEQKS